MSNENLLMATIALAVYVGSVRLNIRNRVADGKLRRQRANSLLLRLIVLDAPLIVSGLISLALVFSAVTPEWLRFGSAQVGERWARFWFAFAIVAMVLFHVVDWCKVLCERFELCCRFKRAIRRRLKRVLPCCFKERDKSGARPRVHVTTVVGSEVIVRARRSAIGTIGVTILDEKGRAVVLHERVDSDSADGSGR